jgi:hypothetical protein
MRMNILETGIKRKEVQLPPEAGLCHIYIAFTAHD